MGNRSYGTASTVKLPSVGRETGLKMSESTPNISMVSRWNKAQYLPTTGRGKMDRELSLESIDK